MGGLGHQVPFFLPSATLCRVLHSAKRDFAECRPLPSAGHSVALGKATLCRVLDFAECHPVRHSAKSGFAECPIFGTRQSWRHSANLRSPVVNHGTENLCMTLDQAGSTEIYHLPRDEVLSGSQPNLRLLFCAVHTKMNIWSCFFVGANVVQISFHVIFLV